MRFDVVVLGGGLAGYTAAIALLEKGLSCALLSVGQSSLHFSSGSMDFLRALPDESQVFDLEKGLHDLARQDPGHPYSILGPEKTLELAKKAETAFASWGLEMLGSLSAGNHLRLSPFGKLLPTWLSSKDTVFIPADAEGRPEWPWLKIALLTVKDFLDFNPEIVAAQLKAQGRATSCHMFTCPDLEILRQNPSEFRSVNIARVLDQESNRPFLTEAVKKAAQNADAVFMPACLGFNRPQLAMELSKEAAKPIRLIPTLAPSMIGARLNNQLQYQFLKNGGVLMSKDRVVDFNLVGDQDDSSGSSALTIERLHTENHGDIPIIAKDHVLATGSFFSQGLLSDIDGVREAVFGLDLVNVPESRSDWALGEFFGSQPFARFGVKIDAQTRPFLKGRVLANLKAAGLVLGGFDPIRQGCGAGVAAVTALAAAEAILS